MGEEGIQEELEGSKRNKHVYERLAVELAKTGSNKTVDQCRAKMKKNSTRVQKGEGQTQQNWARKEYLACLKCVGCNATRQAHFTTNSYPRHFSATYK